MNDEPCFMLKSFKAPILLDFQYKMNDKMMDVQFNNHYKNEQKS